MALDRAHTRVAVTAIPCRCDVTLQAADLQADAILLEHDAAERADLEKEKAPVDVQIAPNPAIPPGEVHVVVDEQRVVLRGVDVIHPCQHPTERHGRPAATSAFCASLGLPHLIDPGQVALALGGFPDEPVTAVCARCQSPVNVTERIRRQETRER